MVIWLFKTTDEQIIYTIIHVLYLTIIIKSEIWSVAIVYDLVMKQWQAGTVCLLLLLLFYHQQIMVISMFKTTEILLLCGDSVKHGFWILILCHIPIYGHVLSNISV